MRSAVPLSCRVTDGVIVFLAAWTLSCHAVVVAQGTLFGVLLLFPAVLFVLLSAWWRLPGPAHGEKEATRPSEPLRTLPSVLFLGGAALILFVRQDILLVWWSIAVILVLGGSYVLMRETLEWERPAGGLRAERLLWFMALISAVYTLVCHRPDADDAIYVNIAVAAADLPNQVLYADDTIHGIQGATPYLSIYKLHSFELLNGALSFLTGIPVQVCFYLISATLFALLVPLAWARLFRILAPRHWLIAVISLVLILALIGEEHRWYGNFAFVRLWQGKSVLLSVVVPMILTYSLGLGVRASPRTALLLGCSLVAAVGCSSTGLWLAPTIAMLGLASTLSRSNWKVHAITVWAIMVYTVTLGVRYRVDLQHMSDGIDLSLPHGELLSEALAMVVGDGDLRIVVLLAVALSWMVAPPGLGRRFAAIAPGIVWLTLLNPYTSNLVSAGMTGTTYWRTIWALPIPALLALTMVAPFRFGAKSPRLLWLLSLVSILALTDRFGPSPLNDGVRLGRPGFKVELEDYAAAVEVARVGIPASRVVAPPKVAIWIPTLHDRPYPLVVRDYLTIEDGKERQQRLMLTDLAKRSRHRRHDELMAAREALERFAITAFCFRPLHLERDRDLRKMLRRTGFESERRVGQYEIWSRRALHDCQEIDFSSRNYLLLPEFQGSGLSGRVSAPSRTPRRSHTSNLSP